MLQFDSNSVGPPPSAQIVVWGFSPLVTPEQVQTYFRPFGEIQELDYKVDSSSGASLGVCRIKYKVDKKDLMSGHVSAKKAVQEAGKIRLGGSFVQCELDKDGLKTIRRVGEAVKKRHAEHVAREQAAAAQDTPPIALKPIPTGPASERREKSPPALVVTPPPPPALQPFIAPDHLRLNSDPRRSIDSRTSLNESSRSRRTSPPPRNRQQSISDTKHRARSPDLRSYPRERERSRSRPPNSPDRSRRRDRSRVREDRGYQGRSRSRSRSIDRRRDSRLDSRRYSPRRRRDSRSHNDYHRRRSPSPPKRHRSPSPRSHRPDDRAGSPLEKSGQSSSSIDEYRPAHSARFRQGIHDRSPSRERKERRDLSPEPSLARSRPPQSERDEERGRPRKRSPIPRTRTPNDSHSPLDRQRSTNHERGRRRDPSSSPRRLPVLSTAMSHKLGGRPYIFINDRDLPVRRFSSRDLGLCFKKFHPSVFLLHDFANGRYMMMIMDFILHFTVITMLEIVMLLMAMEKVSLTVIDYECNLSMIKPPYELRKRQHLLLDAKSPLRRQWKMKLQKRF